MAQLTDTTEPKSAPVSRPVKVVSPEHLEIYRVLRHYPLFDGIPNDDLQEAVATNELSIKTFWRDDLVADAVSLAERGPAIYLVKSGQVAVAMFPLDILAREREEYSPLPVEEKQKKVRSQGPLIRLADKNLATFGEGEIFNTAAIPAAEPERCAFYCVSPCELVVFTQGRMAHFTSKYTFFAQRLRRAVEVVRDRLAGIVGIKQEILDFFVRHGLSVAETLRVRQIDRCIECKECEIACATRYGHKRLTIAGPRLGMLDFVFACRTCTDQRCISPCNYDSIKFDGKKHEVVINESTCTGCAACANACPYGSIEMVEVDAPAEKLFKIRLDRDGALKHGPDTGRKVAATRIASKCDHCAGHSDQACISHCPTGSLIEIKPSDLFQDRGEVARQAVRSGFDQTVMIDPNSMLPSEPFKTKGLSITDGADAKMKPRRIHPGVLWGLGLGSFFLSLLEIVLRLWKPTLSLQYASLRLSGLEPEIAAMKVHFRPGNELAVWFGYIGTALMVIALLYPLWKKSRLMQKIGSSMAWFDWHLMGGTVGPLFIILHSAMKLDNWVSIAFWSMILVVLSGVVGRYLYTQVPDLLHGRELEELEHERSIAKLRASAPKAVKLVDDELMEHRKRCTFIAEKAGLFRAVVFTVIDDLRRPLRWLRLRLALGKHPDLPRKLRRELLHRATTLYVLERRRILVPRAHSVLFQWKQVHVPFTFVMMGVSIIHIAVALTYSM